MNPNTLFPHNLHAYNEIMQAFAEGKRKVCVEHATATGKSYLITAVSDHFERVVIIIPGEEVREQVRDTVIKLSPERSLMPDFITYQKLTEDNKAGLMESDYKNKYDLIVIDEYHHTGAKEWGKAIQALIDNNADAKVFFNEHGHFPTQKDSCRLNSWARYWWKNTYLKNGKLHQNKADMLLAIGFEYKGKKQCPPNQ